MYGRCVSMNALTLLRRPCYCTESSKMNKCGAVSTVTDTLPMAALDYLFFNRCESASAFMLATFDPIDGAGWAVKDINYSCFYDLLLFTFSSNIFSHKCIYNPPPIVRFELWSNTRKIFSVFYLLRCPFRPWYPFRMFSILDWMWLCSPQPLSYL